jgi:hypothetical protein
MWALDHRDFNWAASEQIVGREQRERELIADFRFESRRRANSTAMLLRL